MITVKTFQSLRYSDSSWTGGPVKHYEDHLEVIDKQINDYAKEHSMRIAKVDYSIVNENTQIGTSERNAQRDIYLIAAAHFENQSE